MVGRSQVFGHLGGGCVIPGLPCVLGVLGVRPRRRWQLLLLVEVGEAFDQLAYRRDEVQLEAGSGCGPDVDRAAGGFDDGVEAVEMGVGPEQWFCGRV